MNRKASQTVDQQIIGQIEGRQVVGMDIAKHVFQLHTVERTGEITSVKLKREKVLEFFVNRAPCTVGIEACGGAHHWARELVKLGHDVRLIHAKAVRPFVGGNKTDAADAQAIWTAIQQPGVRFVGIKTIDQQAALSLHRQRKQLIKIKNMQASEIRGLLGEFGLIFAQNDATLLKQAPAKIEELEIHQYVKDSFLEQLERVRQAQRDIDVMDRRIAQLLRSNEDMQRVLQIPGVGPLTATAAIATMGDARAFKSAREFCAWLGLVPRQRGTGGKVKLLGISKRGDSYLRTLLIHGARSVLHQSKNPGPWLEQLKARRPGNVAVVALAAKIARTIWAVTAHQRPYQKGYQSAPPMALAA